jgi:hypothetical protein
MNNYSNDDLLQFDEFKTIQAASILLKKASGCMNYLALIKMLYIADCKALSTWGKSITDSCYSITENGIILSEVFDLINEFKPGKIWKLYLQKNGSFIKLIKEPGEDELCKADEKLLKCIFNNEIINEFNKIDYNIIINSNRKIITIEEILLNSGLSSECINSTIKDLYHHICVMKILK